MITEGLPEELRATDIYPSAKLAWIMMQQTEPVTAPTVERAFGLSEAQSTAAFKQLRDRGFIKDEPGGVVRAVGGGRG